MPLLYATIILVILGVITLITGKILKKNKIQISGIAILSFVIIFWIGFYIWALYESDTEYDRRFQNESTTQEQKDNVDLSALNDYFGDKISYENGIELLNKIKNEYQKDLVNSTENGDSKGLYLYFSKNAENNVDTITHNAVIGMIDDYIKNRESDNTGDFKITTGIDENNKQYIYILKVDKTSLKGSIVDIKDNYIIVRETDGERNYKVNANIVNKLFKNYRTAEDINIADVKVGDYYIDGNIVRNISGEEWKKECIKNLAYCYDEGKNLICNPQKITNVENKGNNVIITLIMEDSTTKYFNEDGNIETFELQAIAYSSLEIPTVSGNVTVYNLKEETEFFMFWIGLDKNTINDKYPTINDIEIYDK